MRLCAAALSDKGKKRELNEDSVWSQAVSVSEGEPLGLFIVCDGIGGHLGGECASHWAIEAVKVELADIFKPVDPRDTIQLSEEEVEGFLAGVQVTNKLPETDLRAQVVKAIEKANNVVWSYAQHKPRQAGDAGTTLTMAMVKGDTAIVANVGDSRTYLLRDHKLRQITEDHSLVATLVASGQIQPEEIFTHPQRNVIFRSLGMKDDVQPDLFIETLQTGDYLLLCSDGLWEMIQDPKVIVKLIEGTHDLPRACHRLIKAANDAGGDDNISAVVVRVD